MSDSIADVLNLNILNIVNC